MRRHKYVVDGSRHCAWWKLISSNGREIAQSTSCYTRKRDAIRAVKNLITLNRHGHVPTFEVSTEE